MEYHSIKVHVPTPEISKLVQEKLFEEGCSWLGSGDCVKYTDYKYLFVNGNKILSRTNQPEYFHRDSFRQLHYLQVLTGDDSGVLFRYYKGGEVIYAVGDTHYWVDRNNGKLYSVINRCGTNPSDYTLLNVNEEEIMDYRNIKIHVPTPEISKLVQEKLFEKGCTWYSGDGVKHTHRNYLNVDACNLLSWIESADSFHREESKQVHYLQVLTGDDSGTLFRYYLKDRVYYQLDGVSYWVDEEGCLKSNTYDLEHIIEVFPYYVTPLDVNEEAIVPNEMPTLEAGKHVIRDNHGALHLILDTELEGISGFAIGGGRGFDAIDSENYITEVHRIFDVRGALCESAYNESTLIWKRDDKAAEARKQYDELQRQIKQLQEQADKLGEKL